MSIVTYMDYMSTTQRTLVSFLTTKWPLWLKWNNINVCVRALICLSVCVRPSVRACVCVSTGTRDRKPIVFKFIALWLKYKVVRVRRYLRPVGAGSMFLGALSVTAFHVLSPVSGIVIEMASPIPFKPPNSELLY